MGASTVSPAASTRFDARAVTVFFVLAYAISWGWAIPLAASGAVVGRGHAWPTHYPALLGPAIAAVVVTAWTEGRAGLADLGRRMVRWRVGLRWWSAAVSPAALVVVVLLGGLVVGRQVPPLSDFGRFSGTPAAGVLGVFLLITLVNGVGEETGWRGYALPQLERRFSPRVATLVVGLLWYGWHIPQFFLIATYREFAPVQYVGMFVGLLAGAVVLTWLYNRTASVLLVIVWHGVYNLVGGTQAATGIVAAAVTTLIIGQAVVLLVLDGRARRDGRPSPLRPPD